MKFLSLGLKNATKGPSAVTESLVLGLQRNNLKFRLTPIDEMNKPQSSELTFLPTWNRSERSLIEFVHHFGSPNLAIGPNIQHGEEFLDFLSLNPQKYSRYLLVNKKQLHSASSLWPKIKFLVWQTGIDTAYWRPRLIAGSRKPLIYLKSHDGNFSSDDRRAIERLQSRFKSIHFIKYGRYTPYSFRKVLRNTSVAYWFGVTESQGMALAETWSCNVPTVVRFSGDSTFDYSCFAPMLKDECGLFARVDDIGTPQLEEFLTECSHYWSPRSWTQQFLNCELKVKQLVSELDESYLSK